MHKSLPRTAGMQTYLLQGPARRIITRAAHRRVSNVSAPAPAGPGVRTEEHETTDTHEAAAVPHVSVLLAEVLQAFRPVRLKVYVDCTLGAGGHAVAIAGEHSELRVLAGIDMDPTAHAIAASRLQAVARPELAIHHLSGNYGDVKQLLDSVPGGLNERVNGMLMDLGVSSMQFDSAERGFSFMRDAPIDMRMDPNAALSAEEVLNTWSEAELGRIIRDYGEEKMWRGVAARIVQAREQAPIRTTHQLVATIGRTQLQSKGGRSSGKHIHPATRTFQALRIAVNDELQRLEQALPDALAALAPGGRLAVISFHSLEDRLVKHVLMRAAGRASPDEEYMTHGQDKFAFLDRLEDRAIVNQVTRKPIIAGEDEIAANPRSRSAKLRVVEKI